MVLQADHNQAGATGACHGCKFQMKAPSEAAICCDPLLEERELAEGWLTKAVSFAALALAIGAGVAGLAGMQSQRQPPAQVAQVAPGAQQEDNQKTEFIRRINDEYRLNIGPDQVDYIRPSDVIKPMWGEKWGEVLSKAKASQEFEKIGGEERPTIISAGTPRVGLLDSQVPVIFAQPSLFGGGPNARGVCFPPHRGLPRFCVVNNRANLNTLRHELTHSLQDPNLHGSLALGWNKDDYYLGYMMNEKELGVRLAEMKRNFYHITNKIATADEEEARKSGYASFGEMILHFYHHPGEYSEDVQLLENTISQAHKGGLLDRLVDYMKSHLDKVVRAKQPGTSGTQTT
jgi:hypothetical protein